MYAAECDCKFQVPFFWECFHEEDYGEKESYKCYVVVLIIRIGYWSAIYMS